MNDFQLKVLNYLNITNEDYYNLTKEITLNDLEDPFDFLNMARTVERIKKAIENDEKIMVYGDYDCDGISATAIIVNMFKKFNKKIGYYIPSRYIDGYGINLAKAQLIKDKKYNLVITVDNGVAAKDAIEFLTDNGVDVILTDHHEIINELPRCFSVIHPDLKNSNHQLKQCGAYVAFMLSVAVLGYVDEYLLSLAGQATISDLMPLIGYNRDIVRLMLKYVNNNLNHPIRLLTNDEIIDESSYGFSICPKINAYGRIKEDTSVNDVVLFFITDSIDIQRKLSMQIQAVNIERMELLKKTISKLDLFKYEDKKVIVEVIDNVSEGLIGLIASRILSELKKPCIIFTNAQEDNVLKASARSLKGLDLSEMFKKFEKLLLVYGGHAEAGGLSINKNNYDEFKLNVENYVKDLIIEEEKEEYISINKTDLSYENYQFLKALSPFGHGFNCPYFQLNLYSSDINVFGKDMNHIRGKIGFESSFIGFNLAEKIIKKDKIICVGQISYNTYLKGKNIVYQIRDILN